MRAALSPKVHAVEQVLTKLAAAASPSALDVACIELSESVRECPRSVQDPSQAARHLRRLSRRLRAASNVGVQQLVVLGDLSTRRGLKGAVCYAERGHGSETCR